MSTAASPVPEGADGTGDRVSNSTHSSPHRHRSRPAVNRVSSLLNLNLGSGRDGRHMTTPPPGSARIGTLDRDLEYDRWRKDTWEHMGWESIEPGLAWHNPNLDQIAESLQSAMMVKRDPRAPLPIKYNACVLRLIEGFRNLRKEQKKIEHELVELNQLREKELEEFRGISEEWIERETKYKAEIKRLELLLVKETSAGMATVALARHDSVVDRSGTKKFQDRMKRMSNSLDRGRFLMS